MRFHKVKSEKVQSERTLLDFSGRGTEPGHPTPYYSVLLTYE